MPPRTFKSYFPNTSSSSTYYNRGFGGSCALHVSHAVHGLAVGVEEGLGDEALAAALARVGPLAGVVALVGHEGGPLGEGLAAGVADERPLARVRDAVGAQQGLAVEALVADGTAVGPLARVQTSVDLQALGRLELLAALGAQVSAIGPLHAAGTRPTTTALLRLQRGWIVALGVLWSRAHVRVEFDCALFGRRCGGVWIYRRWVFRPRDDEVACCRPRWIVQPDSFHWVRFYGKTD